MEDMRSRIRGGDVEAEKAAAIKVTLRTIIYDSRKKRD